VRRRPGPLDLVPANESRNGRMASTGKHNIEEKFITRTVFTYNYKEVYTTERENSWQNYLILGLSGSNLIESRSDSGSKS
jgi:hypothetical protein